MKNLPAISNPAQLKTTLQTWRATLNAALNKPTTPAVPRNFQAKQGRGGNQLSWSLVSTPGVDGYEVLKSPTGNFSAGNYTVISLPDKNANSYFDSLGGGVTKMSYQVRATAGTQNNPQSVHGNPSATITQSSLDATDNVSVPTTVLDKATTDDSAAAGAGGSYISLPQDVRGRNNQV